MKIDKEDKALLESYDRDEWKSERDFDTEARRFRESARATFRKDKRVNIRISEKDLADIKKRALEEGLPYQTLMSSVLHKYVAGRLSEKMP